MSIWKGIERLKFYVRVVHGGVMIENPLSTFFSINLTYLMKEKHSMSARGQKLKKTLAFQNDMYET